AGIYRFEPTNIYSQEWTGARMISVRRKRRKRISPPAIDVKSAVEKLRANGIYKNAKSILTVVDGSDTEQLCTAAQADGKQVFRILIRNMYLYFPWKGNEPKIKPVAVDMVISGCETWNRNGNIYDGRQWKRNVFRRLTELGFIRTGTILVALAGESQQAGMPDYRLPIFAADLILSPERGLEVVFDESKGLPRYAVRLIESCGGTFDVQTTNSITTEVKDVNEQAE
ncbi:MAG: hypothetical protein NT118_15120, partial [Lentisphaerae bacterium]|nr:hypothetical protein [Lentisphaerota bacterium]